MFETHSPSAVPQTHTDSGKIPAGSRFQTTGIRTRPLFFPAGLTVCVALLWLSPLSVMNLTAGPKYRAFQKNPSIVTHASDVQRIAAASHFRGEVSDNPPVFIDGEFSTIGGASISNPHWNQSQRPMATVDTANPDSEHRYQVKANSLQNGLARMAALYHNLGGLR